MCGGGKNIYKMLKIAWENLILINFCPLIKFEVWLWLPAKGMQVSFPMRVSLSKACHQQLRDYPCYHCIFSSNKQIIHGNYLRKKVRQMNKMEKM